LGFEKGLKEYGAEARKAVVDKLKQLHDKGAVEPIQGLTRNQKRASLRYLMYITKKKTGRIKARGCADGRKQRETMSKDEASSPTVAIESVFLSCVVDAEEKREVVVTDVPGAYLHADMDKEVHMCLTGKMAELLVRVKPELYRKYVEDHNGKKVLYVRLRKALYGCLKSGQLFWQHLSNVLEKDGFEINPYDTCVANKIVNGKQCTIVWHVDDLKISHVEQSVVDNVIIMLESTYGKMPTQRGKNFLYLGMTLDYSTENKVKINMQDFVKTILEAAPEEMQSTASTPAAHHLFMVNEDAAKLEEERAQLFHTFTAKLLFLCKRARPDIQTAVAFLTTRVISPDEDDWKKLARTINYLRLTKDLNLTLESDGTMVLKWWVDGAFAVHPDMRSHTGGTMSMGKGAIYSTSTKQKINTRSSTEAELVAVHDVLPQVLWTRYFLEHQGYKVKDTTMYQDNLSAMLLENNGKGSSSKRTRHINIRYFFVTDMIRDQQLKVQHEPTGTMIGDFFTKPLQGTAFRVFRDKILNIDQDQK